MASTFTTNIQLEEPARGDDVGTWDTPVNANMTLIDLILGGQTTISLNNSNIVLSAAQFQSRHITFNSTLTGSVSITFPTSFKKAYEIEHTCTGSSAFTITLQTTASGGQVICASPGETIECWNDGTNIKYKNLARVGQYWDYGGSSVPAWVSGCTVPPYLNCDASTFSAVTYPQLAVVLGGTTLPDSRGRGRWALNQGTGRVTSGVSGVDGNTRGAAGGDQSMQAHAHANSLSDPGHSHAFPQLGSAGNSTSPAAGSAGTEPLAQTNTVTTGIQLTNATAGSGSAQNMPPVYVGGLTLIRAA